MRFLVLGGGVQGCAAAFDLHFNYRMARMAVDAGVHFTDLGGNTAIVSRQRGLDAAARGKGVSVAPDIGLAPGRAEFVSPLTVSLRHRFSQHAPKG